MNNEIILIDEEIVDNLNDYEDEEFQTTFLDNLEIIESECEIENVFSEE